MATPEILNQAKESLQRMQDFNTQDLPRSSDLGSSLNFSEVVPDAERLKELYTRLPITVLEDFTDDILNQIKQQADGDFNRFKQILDFDPNQGNPGAQRTALINEVKAAYDAAFKRFYPYLAYSMSRTMDISRMETDARAVFQQITDKTDSIQKELESSKKEADAVLEEIRKVAAEQGVSQQAIYYKTEAEDHATQADTWRKATIYVSIAVGVFAAASLFLHKIPFLKPDNSYDSIQLVASKVLIFGILSYMLILCAKNFLSHKHNSIINKHRQNALMTFKALVEASGKNETKEIVLAHASSCIFSPQDTGYSKSGGGSAKSIVELLPKAVMSADEK
jgi:ElaB/YqjD/DUF883 family membrane-anchored ribosome-binding protein